jgi:hypothetical protein
MSRGNSFPPFLLLCHEPKKKKPNPFVADASGRVRIWDTVNKEHVLKVCSCELLNFLRFL